MSFYVYVSFERFVGHFFFGRQVFFIYLFYLYMFNIVHNIYILHVFSCLINIYKHIFYIAKTPIELFGVLLLLLKQQLNNNNISNFNLSVFCKRIYSSHSMFPKR